MDHQNGCPSSACLRYGSHRMIVTGLVVTGLLSLLSLSSVCCHRMIVTGLVVTGMVNNGMVVTDMVVPIICSCHLSGCHSKCRLLCTYCSFPTTTSTSEYPGQFATQ
jgi:hypothetical protein